MEQVKAEVEVEKVIKEVQVERQLVRAQQVEMKKEGEVLEVKIG